MHDDVLSMMNELTNHVHQQHKHGSFHRLFWDQQLQAAKQMDSRQMRWHPQVIRWCLHLRLVSAGGYRLLHDSGVIRLPSEWTLRDYTHYIPPQTGFQDGVPEQLSREAKLEEIEDWQKYVCLTYDEMKIKERLVYNKFTDQFVGFVALDDVGDHILEFERQCQPDGPIKKPELASHMLVLLIRGIFTGLKFPLAQFATTGAASHQLYPIVSEAVMRLEIMGFKVISLTSNGSSPNRKVYRLMKDPSDATTPAYRCPNPFTDEDRSLYFIADVPHLLKTTINCWSNSYGHNRKRTLWVSYYVLPVIPLFMIIVIVLKINGKHISWQHLVRIYEGNCGRQSDTPGLNLLPRIKFHHLHLNSFSRMRVDLAAQVHRCIYRYTILSGCIK